MIGLLFVSALAAQVGQFEAHGDIGVNPRAGSAAFDSRSAEYRITGGGENIWATADAFHFVWKRLDGGVSLTADVRFEGAGGNAHRKAGWMIRQSLDPGSPYADAVLHGDGLTALQYRETAGGITKEVRADITAPSRIRLERRGNTFTLSAAKAGEPLRVLASVDLNLTDPVYAGLAVCSHDANALETAVLSNVSIAPAPPTK